MTEVPAPKLLRDGRYVVVGLLGEGAQGATLDAVDKREGRKVAIKEFRVRGAKAWKDVELAEREARVLSTLSHPNLPAYVEHFEENGVLYLVLEHIEGETLAALRKRSALARSDVVRFLHQAATTLDYLHGRSPAIVHRDIKPSNIIVRPDGSFAFVDFGSVRDHLKPEGGSTVVGTFGYMAPEQFQGRAGPGSDIYAVGATALCLLTGREPENLPHRGLTIDVEKALTGIVNRDLIRVLTQMVEPNPDLRPERLAPLLEQLRDAEPSYSHNRAAPPHPNAEGPRPRSDWHPPHGARHEPAFVAHLGPFLVALFIIGLGIARVSTWALFRVFLPMLLTLLSLFFGRALVRAARRCNAIGISGERGLAAATNSVQSRYRAPRIRVATGDSRPVHDTTASSVDEHEYETEAEPEDPRVKRGRRH